MEEPNQLTEILSMLQLRGQHIKDTKTIAEKLQKYLVETESYVMDIVKENLELRDKLKEPMEIRKEAILPLLSKLGTIVSKGDKQYWRGNKTTLENAKELVAFEVVAKLPETVVKKQARAEWVIPKESWAPNTISWPGQWTSTQTYTNNIIYPR